MKMRSVWIILHILDLISTVIAPLHPEGQKHQMEDLCYHNPEGPYGIYQSKNGDWCCLCPRGYHLVEDCMENRHRDPMSRICEKCVFDENDANNQNYTDRQNNMTECMMAHNATYCNNFPNTYRVAGNTTTNSRCECTDGHYNSGEGCIKHSTCEKGLKPIRLGNKTHNIGGCEKCPDGTFSDEDSATDMCHPFTDCKSVELIKIKDGNSESDVQCGSSDNYSTPNPNTTKNITTPNPQESELQESDGDGWGDGFGIGFGVGFAAAVFIIIIIYAFFRRCRNGGAAQRNPDDQNVDGIERQPLDGGAAQPNPDVQNVDEIVRQPLIGRAAHPKPDGQNGHQNEQQQRLNPNDGPPPVEDDAV